MAVYWVPIEGDCMINRHELGSIHGKGERFEVIEAKPSNNQVDVSCQNHTCLLVSHNLNIEMMSSVEVRMTVLSTYQNDKLGTVSD